MTPIDSQTYSKLANTDTDPSDRFKQELVKKKASGKIATLPLDVAIQQVQKALDTYRVLQSENPKLPPLKSAEFDFKVTRTSGGGLSLNLWIITIGGKAQKQGVNDVTFTYTVPTVTPTPAPREKGFGAKFPTLQENLVSTIQEATLAAKNKFQWGGQDLDEGITIKLDYGVEVQFNAGLQIPIYTLTVGPSASWDKNAVQSVKLVFEKPSPSVKPPPSVTPSPSP